MIEYVIFLLISIVIYTVLVQSYNLVLGYIGSLHLGHIGFYAVGAYTSALLTINGVPFLISLLTATAMGALVGFLVGLPSMRLKRDYLAIATLAFGEIIRLTAANWISLTNGPLGITKIPRPTIFGYVFQSSTSTLLLYLLLAGIAQFIMYKIIHSPYGKVIETIREDELASRALGKNTTRIKLQVFTISAGFAAFAGCLYAHAFNYIDPTLYKISETATLLIMVILGGLGNFWGAIAGAFGTYFIFEPIRFLPISATILGPLRRFLYAITFIIIILFRPQGLIGKLKKEPIKKS